MGAVGAMMLERDDEGSVGRRVPCLIDIQDSAPIRAAIEALLQLRGEKTRQQKQQPAPSC
jgi:hypothetical protein